MTAAGPTTTGYRLALIGFGTVGQGLAEILSERRGRYRNDFGADFELVAVSDINRGSIYHPAGLEPELLLRNADDLERIDAPHKGWDSVETIVETNADVVLEMAYTDLETGEPGFSHARAALASGKHIVMSNKGPVALRFPELLALAGEKGRAIGVEATVMSGTPTLALGTEMLKGAGVTRIEGILNGTTNYILTRMGEGLAYPDALAEAQQKGYAEADPTGDIEGVDAAGKVAILANLVMGLPVAIGDVERQGISHLTPEDVRRAEADGRVWKLIGTIERSVERSVERPAERPVERSSAAGGPERDASEWPEQAAATGGAAGYVARVAPEQVELTHPLAGITGATNAVTFTTDYLGDVTLVGPGAGRLETGYAMIADLLKIHRESAGSTRAAAGGAMPGTGRGVSAP
jgi:homoserine dehydrogenase